MHSTLLLIRSQCIVLVDFDFFFKRPEGAWLFRICWVQVNSYIFEVYLQRLSGMVCVCVWDRILWVEKYRNWCSSIYGTIIVSCIHKPNSKRFKLNHLPLGEILVRWANHVGTHVCEHWMSTLQGRKLCARSADVFEHNAAGRLSWLGNRVFEHRAISIRNWQRDTQHDAGDLSLDKSRDINWKLIKQTLQ